MATIKLKKGPLSYDGIVHATSAEPFVRDVDDDTAAAAVESGFFELVPESKPARQKGGKGGKNSKDPEHAGKPGEKSNEPPVPDDVELGQE